MNIAERLRDEAQRDHPNPMAGRGPVLIGAVRRRRHRRSAAVAGVAAAAAVAGALALGPWLRPAPVIDPATTTPSNAPTSAAPTTGPFGCGAPISDIVPQPVTADVTGAELPDGVSATLAAGPSADGERLEVVVILTNGGEVPITIRERGNEIWAVDDSGGLPGQVAGYAAGTNEPADLVLATGATAAVGESVVLTPCAGDVMADGSYNLVVRGTALGGQGRDYWAVGGFWVDLVDGRVVGRETPAGAPVSDAVGEPFRIDTARPWVDWPWPDTGLAMAAVVDPGPYSAAQQGAAPMTATVTVTNTSDERLSRNVVPWLALLVETEEGHRIVMSTHSADARSLDLAPGGSVELDATLSTTEVLTDHLLPDQPVLGDGEHQVVVVLLDADRTAPFGNLAYAYAVSDPQPVTTATP